ncbi:MAG: cell division protein [Alphaproteobacteria bacterium PA2]|nr:MAG: cell division protein [Alphaproteobacteria bacterium PA2]
MSDAFARRWRPAPFLPESDNRDGSLIFVVATLCFLACLMALTVLATNRAVKGWSDQLNSQATIIVRPRANETPDLAAARAAEALAGVPGVTEARALEREKAEALVEPWLGDITDLEDLPIPRLVAVDLDNARPASSATLAAALKARGIDGIIDDHSIWTRDIARSAGVLRWVCGGVFILITASAGAIVAFATRAGLLARREVVEVLHLTGAENLYIARLFQARFAQLAAWAGALGAIGAAGVGAILRLAGGGGGLTPAIPIIWSDLLAVAPCPLVAALVAAIAARLTAERMILEIT